MSNMYPSAEHPDLGVFVAELAAALRARGHDVDEAVLRTRAAGPLRTPAKYVQLAAASLRAAGARPDVVYAHFLFPPGAIARLAARRAGAPYVVTAHGQDVANVASSRLLRAATRFALGRAAAVVCVSRYLAERLPATAPPVEVIDSGVDTRRFTPAPRASGAGPRFLFAGTLTPRKNVARLLRAFERVGEGTLTIIGDGPLAAELRAAARGDVRFLGALPRETVRDALREADVVCLPSLVEPLGQAALEGLATGRPVVATRVGGPPEYVDERCGALVDPLDVESIAAGMRYAASLPVPCEAAVAVAEAHALDRQAARIEAVLARAAGDAA